MAKPVDYYIAAIADAIEQTQDQGTRDDGACALPLSTVAHYYSQKTFINEKPLLSNQTLLHEALQTLAKSGLIDVWSDEFADSVIYVPKPQSLFDSLKENDPFQRLYMLKDNGHNWLSQALSSINSQHGDIRAELQVEPDTPDVDVVDIWEPIPIEVDGQFVQEAIAAAEHAIEQVEINNGYAATYPEERNSILATMKGTVESMKSGMPSRQSIVAGLLAPLRYLAKKFGEASMGEAAKLAITALSKLLFGS